MVIELLLALLPLYWNQSSATEENVLKMKGKPCEYVRDDKAPLQAESCSKWNDNYIILTTCTGHICRAKEDEVKYHKVHKCQNLSPSRPRFAELVEVRSRVASKIKESERILDVEGKLSLGVLSQCKDTICFVQEKTKNAESFRWEKGKSIMPKEKKGLVFFVSKDSRHVRTLFWKDRRWIRIDPLNITPMCF